MPEINRRALDAFRNFRPDNANPNARVLDDAEKLKTVDNGVSTIQFFKAGGVAGGPIAFLNADPAPVADPARLDKVIEVTPERLQALRGKPDDFARLLKDTIAARKDYLQPRRNTVDVPTHFKFNAIVGLRVEQFMNEGLKLAQELYGNNRAQLDKALYAVNTTTFDLYSREMVFDHFETNGYASFGHDAAFIHAWELRLSELNKLDTALLTPDEQAAVGREKQQIQGELDAIFRSKYVYNNSAMYEVNAEISVGLCLIDKNSRQRVSEKASTLDSLVPRYELLNVRVNGEDKSVYYDASEKKYYFDKSAQVVPQELVPQIQRRDVDVGNLTFRRAESGEPLRKNFRFDWNGDGFVSKAIIDWTSWAGHCDVKAIYEAHGLVVPEGHAGVYEYDSRSGSVAHYNRDLLNEKLLSFGELSSAMKNVRTNRRSTVDNEPVKFAGARDDDLPDRLVFGQTNIPFNSRPNEFTITKIVTRDKTYDNPNDVFREHIVAADQRSASPNPLFAGIVEGDRVQLRLGNAAIHADVKMQIFDDDSGYPTTKSAKVVLDFNNPAEKPVLVDTVMADPDQRLLWEISVDTKNKRWVAQQVQMVKKPEGRGYDKKEVGQPVVRNINPNELIGQRETSLDNPAEFMPFIKEVLHSAKNFVAETADGAGVWNGRTKRIKQATVWRDDDSKWAKVSLEVEARYGHNHGSFLVKLKDDGKPDFFVPLEMPFDFAWRTDAAFSPVVGDDVNEKALERGVVTQVGNRYTAEAVTNMLEILHCAFNERKFVINHNGQRFFYENRQDWEAAKGQLDQLRSAVRGADVPPPVGIGTLLAVANGQVARQGLVQHQVTAQADGQMTITLDTKRGDADLYVRVGGAAGAQDGQFTHRSWKADLERDQITLDVKKGDVIGIGVHGYKDSDFALEVTGPKAGGQVEPAPAPIDARVSGVVTRGQFINLEQYPLEIRADGVLDFKMFGSGDADVYVGVNREPTRQASDWRLTGANSNEAGTLRVKAGDKVYVKVYGYAPRSDFDLTVKSQ